MATDEIPKSYGVQLESIDRQVHETLISSDQGTLLQTNQSEDADRLWWTTHRLAQANQGLPNFCELDARENSGQAVDVWRL